MPEILFHKSISVFIYKMPEWKEKWIFHWFISLSCAFIIINHRNCLFCTYLRFQTLVQTSLSRGQWATFSVFLDEESRDVWCVTASAFIVMGNMSRPRVLGSPETRGGGSWLPHVVNRATNTVRTDLCCVSVCVAWIMLVRMRARVFVRRIKGSFHA